MNLRKYISAVCATAMVVGVTSCADEAGMDGGAGKQMNFSAYVDKPLSRVTGNAWDGDERIGVKVGDNVKAYRVDTDGKMTAEGEPYQWEGTGYELLAWTPLTDEPIALTDQATEEKLYACDLLVSNAKAESKNVHFTFTHKMTRMWWELQKYDGYTAEEMRAAKVSFIGYGAVAYTDGELTAAGAPDQLIATHNTMGEYYRNGDAMMVPCEMWEKPLIQIEIGGDTYVYTPSRENPNDVAKKTGDLLPNTWQRYYLAVSKKGLEVSMKSESIGWNDEQMTDIKDASFKVTIPEAITGLSGYRAEGVDADGFIADAGEGFSITYTETLSSGGIDYEGSCVRSRTAAGQSVTFSFKDIRSDVKLAYTDEYMEVGYFFFSDGTYGVAADVTKSAVGIIYKVGKHDTDDVALYSGADVKRIHGYVVALADESTLLKWKEGAIDNLQSGDYPENGVGDGHTSKYIGYPNTRYLIGRAEAAGNGATVPAAMAATAKNGPAVIAGTSGWYLPSRSQLMDVTALAGRNFEGYTTVDGTYWTSSFDGPATNAYVVHFDNNGTIPNEREFFRDVNSEQKVRLVLTF